MIEMKNSELLDKIIEYAKSCGENENSTFTAEKYLISIIEVVSGTTSISINDKDRENFLKVLSDNLPYDRGLEEIKKSLTEYIKERKEYSYIDGLYIQRCMFKAKEAAKKTGMDQLDPIMLLTCIFEEPSEYIKLHVMNNGKGNGKDVGKVTDATGTPFDKTEEWSDKGTDKERAVGQCAAQSLKNGSYNPKLTVTKLTEKAKNIYDKLVESIFGQDYAVSVFTSGYFRAEILSLTDKKRTRPRATFLFAGPPGVGKTFLAEKAAEVLGLPYQRFDMSEYSDHEANIEFCGSDRVYKNGKEGNVTSFVAKNPKCIILFDEIEKANINVIHLFLQILDAGRIRDNFTDEEVPFTDAIMIFTTNAGKQLYENSETTDFSGVARKVILKALQNDVNPSTGTTYLPAAICSRFASGNVVMFNYITAHSLRDIAKKEVLRHSSNFEKEVGIKIKIDELVYTSLLFAEGGSADARTIKSRAETFFDDELFELFRLLDSDSVNTGIEDLESIEIGVDLPKDEKEICELFARNETFEVLLFASQK
ncbi:MAG: ATP-dependent Clp protease ATP-binding subunit, partial [Oscillospiraceae bacterium]|nr:ATP-dependent Clp protease ATP-binding subunit [Oscillospiraceae bacterium]